MKSVMMLLVAFLPLAFAMQAQDQDQDRDRDRIRLQEHVVLQDGQCYLIKDQDRIRLQEQIRLHNGTVVNPDGSYQLQNGRQRQLREGECMAMDGRRFGSLERFRETEQRRMEHQNAYKDRGMQKERVQGGNTGGKGRRN